MSTKSKNDKLYQELLKKIKKIRNVSASESLLRWDQEVMMPEGGTNARSGQLSTLSSIQHNLLTDEKIGKLLTNIQGEKLSDEKNSVIREIKREYERANSVPNSLIEKISKTSSEAFSKWLKAKKKEDFSIFQPSLEKLVKLKKDYAEHINSGGSTYETLFEDFEPYLGLDAAENILFRLRDNLVKFLEKIRNSEVRLDANLFENKISKNKQERFTRRLLTNLGFDWNRGRLDTSPHPFTTGTQFDSRITTRFEDNFLDGLLSTIHEFGHATYTLGLPREKYGTPLGESRELTVHESQSRLWENHIGRSRPFWEYILPKIKDEFNYIDAPIDEVYEAVNHVRDDNLIRVEADELTYHMHIILRFEIENELIGGDLEVAEIPEVWNEKMESYLSVRPKNDSEGCLQDIHWSHGSFGYFPTYSLGSVLAAQIYKTMEDEIENIEKNIRSGNFGELKKWLKENIHCYGKRYTTDEFIRKITDQDLNPNHFLNYIENKYGSIYEL